MARHKSVPDMIREAVDELGHDSSVEAIVNWVQIHYQVEPTRQQVSSTRCLYMACLDRVRRKQEETTDDTSSSEGETFTIVPDEEDDMQPVQNCHAAGKTVIHTAPPVAPQAVPPPPPPGPPVATSAEAVTFANILAVVKEVRSLCDRVGGKDALKELIDLL